MADKHVLPIERHLAHQANLLCRVEPTGNPFIDEGPDIFNESVGFPLLFVSKTGLPAHLRKRASLFSVSYSMLDFGDFLDFATSPLPPQFDLKNLPESSVAYYQALPSTYGEPLCGPQDGGFAILGACLGRVQNHLWINMHFRVFGTPVAGHTEDPLGDYPAMTHGFANLHLVDHRAELVPASVVDGLAALGHTFHFSVDSQLFEFTRSHLMPPTRNDLDPHNHPDYRIAYSGQMWTDRAESWATVPLTDDDPQMMRDMLHGERERVQRYTEFNHRELAEHFEVARLMMHLPSYFAFMYDLVVSEKQPVTVQRCAGPRGKKRRKGEIVYKIVRSIRVTHGAEEQARQRLGASERSWTAPSYRFIVRGHWRLFPHPWWLGHAPDGSQTVGGTWVHEFAKGSQTDVQQMRSEDIDPHVVVRLKQTLAYARDVIASRGNEGHQETPLPSPDAQPPVGQAPAPAGQNAAQPTPEWIYEERCKLTAGLRWLVLRRDAFKCLACGRGADDGVRLEVDHVVPLARWGRTDLANLRTLCRECNCGKGDRT